MATGKKRALFQWIGVLSVRQAHQKATELCVVIILRRDINMKYYYTIWQCKCCGERFEMLDVRSNKDILNDVFSDYISENNNHITHKCDTEYTGVADFIGIKIVEHK